MSSSSEVCTRRAVTYYDNNTTNNIHVCRYISTSTYNITVVAVLAVWYVSVSDNG